MNGNPRKQGEEILQSIGVTLGKTDAYHWGKTNNGLKFQEENYFSGWWNECYHYLSFQAGTEDDIQKIEKIENAFKGKQYWSCNGMRNKYGQRIILCLTYCEMTQEESNKKALDNLMNGGRMSD